MDLQTMSRTGPSASTANVVPAWRLDAKRKERAERIKLATSTILSQAISGEAATS